MIYPRRTIDVEGCVAIVREKGHLAGQPITKDAYQHIWFEGVYWKSHRLSYKINCEEIPRCPSDRRFGLVLHTCDNKWCVNPKHLYLSSQAQNMKDKVDRHPCWSEMMSELGKGRRLSDSTRQKISSANKGRKLSEETKRRIGLASRGNKNRLGVKQPLEERLKRANSLKGKKRTAEQRARMSEATKAAWARRKGKS